MGIAIIATPEFKEVIKTAFKNDGLFGLIREKALEAGPLTATPLNIQEVVQTLIN